MSLSTQHIIRHLFRVESLEEVSRQQLEELVETYPSFGVGRYLLSRKLQAEKADHFGEETQKTNIYFTNPFWLQWLLQEDLGQPANGWGHKFSVADTTALDEPLTDIPSVDLPLTDVPSADTSLTDIPSADPPPGYEPGLPAEEVFAPVVDTTEPTIDSEATPSSEPDEVGGSLLTASLPPSAADELLKSIAELRDRRQNDAMQTPSLHEEESPSVGIAGLALEQLEETTPVEGHPSPEHGSIQEHPSVEHVSIEEHPSPEHASIDAYSSPEHAPVEELAPAEYPPAVEPAPEEAHPVETIAPAEQTPAPEPEPPSTPEPALPPTPELAHPSTREPGSSPEPIFEPYHTVDYFASQGIRLVLDENPSDKLGKQLKSFTDWLKVMRKLPQKNREIVPDIAAERQVQAIAAHSIERRDVITEAMAEVLAKQGMREKATEMYRKLSLLEPEKSAYFAEKIEQLKII